MVATAISLNGQSVSKRGGREVRKRNSTASDNCPAAVPSAGRVLRGGKRLRRPLPGAGGRARLLVSGRPPRRRAPPPRAARGRLRRGRGLCLGRRRARALARSLAPSSRCAGCNPSSHFLVDSLKEAAVAKAEQRLLFYFRPRIRVLTGMPLPKPFSSRPRSGAGGTLGASRYPRAGAGEGGRRLIHLGRGFLGPRVTFLNRVFLERGEGWAQPREARLPGRRGGRAGARAGAARRWVGWERRPPRPQPGPARPRAAPLPGFPPPAPLPSPPTPPPPTGFYFPDAGL